MSTAAFILAHFLRFAENTLITRRDLLIYGTQDAVDSALRRMRAKGFIIRLAWGVYVRPPLVESVPGPEAVAAAKIEAFQRTKVVASLDEAQVHGVTPDGEPEAIFEVDGASSSFQIYDGVGAPVVRIFLRRKVARKMKLDVSPARRAIKALWAIGEERCTHQMIELAVRDLDRDARREFRSSHRWMPGWLSDMIRQIRALVYLTGRIVNAQQSARERGRVYTPIALNCSTMRGKISPEGPAK